MFKWRGNSQDKYIPSPRLAIIRPAILRVTVVISMYLAAMLVNIVGATHVLFLEKWVADPEYKKGSFHGPKFMEKSP